MLDPAEPSDAAVLDRLRADAAIEFIDRHDQQREDLHRLLPPPEPELLAEHCRWAYYPWRRTVVAVLGPRAFRMVRLDRNRNLITFDEQARLAGLCIGVAGLSVGHVIAHTLAAQGVCGELRLADFDRVELSNLNRIPGTILDLGLNKAVVAARRIAELDPYLPVRILDEGLTPDTVDEFLDGVDIVIEECDSLDIKAILRVRARTRRVPVLMATSDRGLVDVERFDVEPERPILHGLLGELDVASLPGLTSREKIPHLLRLLDAGQLSPRLVASALEIDRTLSTWPQAAGEVVLGAAVLTEAVRRIGLGEDLRSGRGRVDIGAVLDHLDEPQETEDQPPPPPIQHRAPKFPGASGVVAAAAIRAPSGGNAQPWHIYVSPDMVTIRLAPEHTSMMDVGLRGSAVALGAALFNAKVAAASQQILGPVTVREGVDGAPLQATLLLRDGSDPALASLYQPTLQRETNRRLGTPQPIEPDTIELLRGVAERDGTRLHLLTSPDDIAGVAVILAASDRIRCLTPRLHEQMVSELRRPGDPYPDTGIDVCSLELDPGGLGVLDILCRSDVMACLARWNEGHGLGDETRRRVAASSAVAVVSVSDGTLTDYARAGSAIEAVWVTAQQHGLAVQPISPVFLYAHDVGELSQLSMNRADELAELRTEFRRLVGVPRGSVPALVLRLAVDGRASVRSRRSLARVGLLRS